MYREEIDLVTITILGLRGFIAKGEIKKGMFRVLADTIDFVTRADYQICKIIDASCHLRSASLSAMPGFIDASCHLKSARYY